MNVFDYTLVEETSKQLYIRALCDLPSDVREALKQAYEKESQPSAKEIFKTMLKNVEVADGKKTLICQDTDFNHINRQTGILTNQRTFSVCNINCLQHRFKYFFGGGLRFFFIRLF